MRRWRGPVALFLVTVAFLVGVSALPTPADGMERISAAEAASRANAQVHAPSWAVRACLHSFGGEHVSAASCGTCVHDPAHGHRLHVKHRRVRVHRGRRHVWVTRHVYVGGYVGRLQFGKSYNAHGSSTCSGSHTCSTCGHVEGDWRNCPECSAYRYLLGAKKKGRAWVRGQWGQTCGSLR